MHLSHPDPARRLATFYWIAVLAAPPIAGALAANGLGMAVVEPWRDLAFLALWSVIEEIVFRGGVQAALLRREGSGFQACSTANLVASALFAGAHAWAHPPLVALGMFPVSLVLGTAYEGSGRRLAPPIALHLYFNAALYATSWLLAR